MYKITYFNRNKGKAVEAHFETMEAATKAANEIFQATGIVVGIEAH